MPRRPAVNARSMKQMVSSNSSFIASLFVSSHLASATLQTATARAEVSASFYFLIIPICNLAPRMKRLNHLPKVWLLVTNCFVLSRPTTVSQEYSRPAS